MRARTPQHTHAQSTVSQYADTPNSAAQDMREDEESIREQGFLQDVLQDRKYHAVRVVLFVVACALITVAIFMLSFTSSQLTRAQQLATSMVQTEQRAEVLLIASHDDADSATRMQCDGVIDLLQRSSVGVDVEYLDVNSCNTSKNVTDPSTYGTSLANSSWGKALAQKLSDHGSYSAVICIDDDALYYVEAIHDTVFVQTPVVFAGINDVAHAQHAFDQGYSTGVMECYDATEMIQAAKQMQPDATRLLVLTDNTASGIGDRVQFEQTCLGGEQPKNTQYDQVASNSTAANSVGSSNNVSTDIASTALTFDDLVIDYVNASTVSRTELGKQVSSAGDETIIVYLGAASDAAGNSYDATQTAYFISQAANQPVYAISFGGVGEGFLASNVIDYEEVGKRAGELTVMILNGTRPADIPLETFTSEGMVFDAQVLSAHNLSASALPASATLVNQNGVSLDSLRPIFLPAILLLLGIACIVAFAFLGYRRTAAEMAEVVSQRNTLERRFYTDHLTDMPNIQWLTTYAASDASKQVRSVVQVTLSDLDSLDDLHGEGTAEVVVKTFSKRLNGIDNIFLVHSGRGDFILGFDSELTRGAEQLDAVQYVLSHPVKVGESTVVVNSYVGALNRESAASSNMSIEEMVAGVDLAVQQAEATGMRGEVVFYDNDMRLAEEHKVDITLLLKSAIDSEDFIVLYQPQIDVATSEVVGYEALVRLRNDKYSPEQFIPIAEENGQIVELDRIVTKKVVQRLATWKKRKQRIRPISINFSYEQLCDEEYLSYLTSLLDEYGVARKLIRVDVRESLFVNDGERARSFVDKLYKAGFGVAIDGFGAGYASIPHVMRIPVDAVKFDRALTEVFLAGGANEDVIASLVSLAHEAHKLVVIEGVETIQQLKMCRNMGCDVVQGFFFSEPLLPERVLRYNPPKIPFLVGEPTHPQLKDGHTPSQSVSEPVCSQPESESSRLRPESGVVHSQPGSKPACSQPGNEPTHQQAEGVTHQGEPGQKS